MGLNTTIVGYDSREQAVTLMSVLVGMLHTLFPYNKQPRVTKPSIGSSPCARAAKGSPCSPLSTRARRWTLLGAWEKALFDMGLEYSDEYVVKAEQVFAFHVEPFSLAEWQGVADAEWVRTVLNLAIHDARELASRTRLQQVIIGLNSRGELKERVVEC